MENELSKISDSINQSMNSRDFVLRTQRQIAKDFRQHGFEFKADFETYALTLSKLLEIVQLKLGYIAENQSSKWLPLMYSLDISEKNYVHFFSNADKNWLGDFAMLVIKREAQKVFFREKLR
jgi:hypothetical protein